ncbi:TIGR03943 family protein [Paenibacillus sp. HN-1]|uniref:TIGR03943 family putative permease subunit n=1 Tax=Paenibacillus TaxID=44249 RepID=UPI001CA86C8A|nr:MULTISPECIES: TIGR03943 family protein [Paenibacillus]MBY9080198.1 TIGR03943 family protein [Paenibacillus sp. CGMCC 1.18879]MBY9083143.1 TIGR03943 family protein [Paenibacillus sinensis]
MAFTWRIRSHYLLRALLLAALSFYIIHLNASDSLHYYLAPRMQKLLLLCPVPLLFITFGMLWHALTGSTDQLCDCEHPLPEGLLKNVTVYGLFALPLLFGLALPDQALGSDMALKKGIVYSISDFELRRKPESVNQATGTAAETMAALQQSGTTKPESSDPNKLFVAKDIYGVEFAELAKRLYALPLIQVDPSIYSETIGAIDMYKQSFVNKPITLQGFVTRQKGMDANRFAISRFLVMCCTADAVPFGTVVHSQAASSLKNDTWVRIDGTIKTGTVNGKEVLQIEAKQIQVIKQPESPYIYTNPDSVAEFDKLYSHGK